MALGERVTAYAGARGRIIQTPTGNRGVCYMLIERTRGLTAAATLAVMAAALAVAGAAHADDPT